MRRQLLPALRMLLVMTVLCGFLYTAVVTVAAQGILGHQADGSLVVIDGDVVGSSLLGQQFTDPSYFHPRPSAIDYDSSLSGATNLGPNNPDLVEAVRLRAAEYRKLNGLDPGESVPVDAVTSSASGLDPDISVRNAVLQADRVATERGIPVGGVLALIDAQAAEISIGYLADPSVNVLLLNLSLDGLASE
jgi:potassium-transporting ATPase KdpC subunit